MMIGHMMDTILQGLFRSMVHCDTWGYIMKIMIHRDTLWRISPWTMYCILIDFHALMVDFLWYYHCDPQHRMALCHLAPSPWRNMGLKVGQLCGTSNLYQLLKLKSLESCYWMLGINAGSSDWSTWKHQHGGFSVAVYNSYGPFYILMYVQENHIETYADSFIQ